MDIATPGSGVAEEGRTILAVAKHEQPLPPAILVRQFARRVAKTLAFWRECYVQPLGQLNEIVGSLRLTLVGVKPVEDFPNHLVVRRHMTSVEDGETLILCRRSKELKHHLLGRFVREKVIVAAVDH